MPAAWSLFNSSRLKFSISITFIQQKNYIFASPIIF
nr:MAG TPA: hypothetical protein [Caudoviricetes sp.]